MLAEECFCGSASGREWPIEVPRTSLDKLANSIHFSLNVWKRFNSLFEQGKASGVPPRAQKQNRASHSGGIHEPENILLKPVLAAGVIAESPADRASRCATQQRQRP